MRVPHYPSRELVSSPRHIEPSVPISSTRLSCPLHDQAYVTSPVGSAFDPGCRPRPTPHPLRPLPSSPCRIPPDFGSCRLLGVFIMRPCLPYRHGNCVAAGLLRSPDITPVLRYSEPIRHRLAVSHFPGFAGYMTYPAPPISRWDEDGFSSCLACPCHRAVPDTPPECLIASVSLPRFMLPSPNRWGLGFRC